MNAKKNSASVALLLVGLLPVWSQPAITERPTNCQMPVIKSGDVLPSGVASGNNILVKVARHTNIWTSTNLGATWSERPSGLPFSLHAVACGQGIFVIVGNEGALLTSPDGISWTVRDSKTDERLRSIVYGNGCFVAVGQGGTVITSKDAVHWTTRQSGTNQRLHGVAFGNGTFVAVGSGGVILTSTKGRSWKVHNSGVTARLHTIIHRGGIFLASGSDQILLTSQTGAKWSPWQAPTNDLGSLPLPLASAAEKMSQVQ